MTIRNVLSLLLLLLCIYTAQGKGDFPKDVSFAVKARFIDTLGQYYRNDKINSPNTINREFDSLEKLADNNGDNELMVALRILRVQLLYIKKLVPFTDAENAILKEIEYTRAHKMTYLEAEALQALGDFYCDNENYHKGFEIFLSAYVLYSSFSSIEFPQKERYLFSLGSAYYRYGDNENAIKYIKEAVAVPTFAFQKSYTEYNTIGLCYRNMGRYDSAEWYFRAIYNDALPRQDSVWSDIVMGNIGITYYYEKKYDQAIPLLENDIKTSLTHHVLKNAVGSMHILGALYYQENKLDKAERIILDAIDLSRTKQFWFDYAIPEKLYTQLFKIYAAQNKPGLATLYADSAMQAKDSNIIRTNTLMLAKSQEKMDQIQRKIADKQLGDQKKINFFLALVSILLLIIGVLAYINQRMTARLNKQITSQKKEVEQLNDVKDRIFNVISHDMRTPVNSLIAFTELLERGNISEEKMAAYAAALKNNLGYTARLLENLLNWARTQMQGFNPVPETFSLLEAIDQVMELVQHEADKKNIQVKKEFESDALVFADMNMFSLTIRNILNNAIKYTPKNGSITLSWAKAGDILQIKVCDTGVGINASFVTAFNDNKSIQPIDSTPGTANEKGTGLGLMLCKTFIGLMKGSITLESTVGKGSCFTVSVPAGDSKNA